MKNHLLRGVSAHALFKTDYFNLAFIIVLFSFFIGKKTTQAQFCLQNAHLGVQSTSLGSPLEGPFQPDEIIVIGLYLEWESIGCNWLHGLVPTFGNGWSPSSFMPSGEPFDVPVRLNQGIGNFEWYPAGVYFNNFGSQYYQPGVQMPPGWFMTGTSGSPNSGCDAQAHNYDPNCSCGIIQGCNSRMQYYTVMTLKTRSASDCAAGLNDLTVDFKIFSDWETGAAPGPGCMDHPSLVKNWALDCSSAGPELLSISHSTFSNHALEIDLNNFLVDPTIPEVTFNWEVQAPTFIAGASSCNDDCGSLIEHTLINNGPVEGIVQYIVTAFNADGIAGTPATFDVAVMSALDVIIEEPGIVCIGECVQLTAIANGGEGNYSYEWENGTGLSTEVCPTESTTYEVTVTDGNGDTVTDEVEVMVKEGPTIAMQPEFIAAPCYGLAPNFLSFTTNAVDFNYSWAGPGITINNMNADTIWPELAGSYELTLVDNISGCQSVETGYITDHFPDPVTISTSESSVCWGSTTYDILSAEPAGGIWTGSVNAQGHFDASNLGTQELTYSYEDLNGCISTESLTIQVADAELPDLEKTEPLLGQYCVGTTYTYCTTAAEEAATYFWEMENADLQAITGDGNCVELIWENEQIAPELCVYYQTNDGCRSAAYCFEGINVVGDWACTVGTSDLISKGFDIFPNPTRDIINIHSDHPFEYVKIYDALGQLKLVEKFSSTSEVNLSISDFSAGIYFMNINETVVKKFIVR